MLEPFLNKLAKHRIILASGSPRRKEILQNIRLPFEIIVSKFEENLNSDDFSSPVEYVVETARRKALEVSQCLDKDGVKPSLIIGADTIVTLRKEILGKPKDEADAFSMLQKLSDKAHLVITGVVLILPSKIENSAEQKMITFHETTEVVMSSMTSDIIKAYIKTGEPLDKAGAYAIQGIGGSLIRSISGDYYNVVGFPLQKFCEEIFNLCQKNIL